jgi:PAS domain S-box-containing protein
MGGGEDLGRALKGDRERVPAGAPEKSGPPEAPEWRGQAHHFLKALVAESLRGVGIVDPQGVIRYANAACRTIYGWEAEELVGRHFRELYADPQALNRMLARARLTGRVDRWPISARTRGGGTVPVAVSLIRVYDEGHQLLGSLALIHDQRKPQKLVHQLQEQEVDLIRLNRRLELANLELERASRLKDEFLANTTHELRTPLNAILGYLRLVLDGVYEGPEEAREFLSNAHQSARSLLNLINELLDSARIEAGKVEVSLDEVEVAQVFAEVKKLSLVQAQEKNLRLTLQPPRGEARVRADAGKLQQVLLNLVANAIKFTPAGEVRVRARSFAARGYVRFEVADTGVGIPPELQPRLFQKFVQGDGSSTRRYGGTGLGLAICRNLVEFMGGQIWLRSPGAGQGTTVYFTLPHLAPAVSRRPAAHLYWRRLEDRERGLQVQGEEDGPVVLVVEDEPQIVAVMTRVLRKHGFRTAYAVTADDGLEGARRLQPGLITIDMGLPARPRSALRSGLDLYLALQKDPGAAGIPVLLVTGHDPPLTPDHSGVGELPPTLTKPFRARELLQKVTDLLPPLNKKT